jgi:ABC-type multidrug transport system fused ATPase/permease subunit
VRLGSFRDVFRLLSREQRFRATELLVLMAVAALLEMFSVAMVIPVLAVASSPEGAMAGPLAERAMDLLGDPSKEALVLAMMAALAVVYGLKALFLSFVTWRQGCFIYGIQANVYRDLFARYIQQPWIFHTQRNSAELIRNATTESTEFMLTVTAQVVLLSECLTVATIAILIAFTAPMAFAVVGGVLAACGLGFQLLARDRVRAWGEIREREMNLRNKLFLEGLGGAKEIRLLGRERYFISRLNLTVDAIERVSRRYYLSLMLPRLALEFIAIATLATSVAVMLATDWPLEKIVPVIGMFGVAAMRVLPSINRILGAVQQISFGAPAIATMLRECGLPLPQTVPVNSGGTRLRGEIRVTSVRYRYPETKHDTIKGISLRIAAGSTVAFIGTSGAGKSTLVDLVLGLLRPTSGLIEVDGRDIHEDLSAWQSQIGYVPQSIYLTDDSLRANIALGVEPDSIDEAAVRRALAAARLEEFVAALPNGLDTHVGERGVRLSGGQRQRIGIARALYRDPTTLVLDEATSALDTDTESKVMEAINALHGTRTILIITHRVASVANADAVFRLERGSLVT